MSGDASVQRRIAVGCCVIYSGAYIARLNLAAALPTLIATFSLTDAQGGLIQTLFALLYAAGQLVNGAIVDRISPRRYIVCGLAASAACNLLFGMAGAYWHLLVLWALNGVAQSMLWTPVVRLLAGWFDANGRKRVSVWISFSMIGGHFAAWALSGYMAQLFSWRLSFVLPGLTQLGFAAMALWLLRDPPGEHITAARGDRLRQAMPMREMIFGTGLWLVLICCVASGFVRDGIMTWGPSILTSMSTGSLSATGLSLIIPVVNLLGVAVGMLFLRRAPGSARQIIGGLMVASIGVSLLLAAFGGGGLALYALLLGLCCALMYGVNPLETVVLPMDYVRFGRVGFAAGIIDSCVYLGAALTSVLGGIVRDASGQTAVFFSWAIAAAIGAIAIFLSIPGARRMLAREEA